MFDPIAAIQKWYKNSSPQSRLITILLVCSLLATALLFMLAGGGDLGSDPKTPAALYMAGVLAKLVFVLLLIYVCAALFRRWLNLSPRSGPERQLRVLETVRLSPRQALHLVSVGDQRLLIGATDQNISLLTSLETDLSPLLDGETTSQPAVDFGSLVRSFNNTGNEAESTDSSTAKE